MIIHHRPKFQTSFIGKVICCALSAALCLTPVPAAAQSVWQLPPVGAMVKPTAGFLPAIVKGVRVNQANPLEFDFIVDQGEVAFADGDFEEESRRLVKYFLASLTTPEEEMWVNLSPYEADRIIPQSFGQTEMGRDLLAQDYLLKQLTASLMYPEDALGAAFWERVYAKAGGRFNAEDIPLNTFNKVWIVPEKAVVYEHGTTAFVVESHLKVMLESDYLAKCGDQCSVVSDQSTDHRPLTTEIIREILIPEIEREVNEGATFAGLRQIYHSMILAAWFKKRLRDSFLGKVYVDQNKTSGVEHAAVGAYRNTPPPKYANTPPQYGNTPGQEGNTPPQNQNLSPDEIYAHYLEAFKVGVYNYIKEEYDPVTQDIIPRKYFSGGFSNAMLTEDRLQITASFAQLSPAQVAYLPQGRGDSDAAQTVRVRLEEAVKAQKVSSDAQPVDLQSINSLEAKVQIRNLNGMRIRPSTKVVNFAEQLKDQLDIEVRVKNQRQWLDAKEVLSWGSPNFTFRAYYELEIKGPYPREILERIKEYFQVFSGEDMTLSGLESRKLDEITLKEFESMVSVIITNITTPFSFKFINDINIFKSGDDNNFEDEWALREELLDELTTLIEKRGWQGLSDKDREVIGSVVSVVFENLYQHEYADQEDQHLRNKLFYRIFPAAEPFDGFRIEFWGRGDIDLPPKLIERKWHYNQAPPWIGKAPEGQQSERSGVGHGVNDIFSEFDEYSKNSFALSWQNADTPQAPQPGGHLIALHISKELFDGPLEAAGVSDAAMIQVFIKIISALLFSSRIKDPGILGDQERASGYFYTVVNPLEATSQLLDSHAESHRVVGQFFPRGDDYVRILQAARQAAQLNNKPEGQKPLIVSVGAGSGFTEYLLARKRVTLREGISAARVIALEPNSFMAQQVATKYGLQKRKIEVLMNDQKTKFTIYESKNSDDLDLTYVVANAKEAKYVLNKLENVNIDLPDHKVLKLESELKDKLEEYAQTVEKVRRNDAKEDELRQEAKKLYEAAQQIKRQVEELKQTSKSNIDLVFNSWMPKGVDLSQDLKNLHPVAIVYAKGPDGITGVSDVDQATELPLGPDYARLGVMKPTYEDDQFEGGYQKVDEWKDGPSTVGVHPTEIKIKLRNIYSSQDFGPVSLMKAQKGERLPWDFRAFWEGYEPGQYYSENPWAARYIGLLMLGGQFEGWDSESSNKDATSFAMASRTRNFFKYSPQRLDYVGIRPPTLFESVLASVKREWQRFGEWLRGLEDNDAAMTGRWAVSNALAQAAIWGFLFMPGLKPIELLSQESDEIAASKNQPSQVNEVIVSEAIDQEVEEVEPELDPEPVEQRPVSEPVIISDQISEQSGKPITYTQKELDTVKHLVQIISQNTLDYWERDWQTVDNYFHPKKNMGITVDRFSEVLIDSYHLNEDDLRDVGITHLSAYGQWIMGVIAKESMLGLYQEEVGGSALGIYQFDPRFRKDEWDSRIPPEQVDNPKWTYQRGVKDPVVSTYVFARRTIEFAESEEEFKVIKQTFKDRYLDTTSHEYDPQARWPTDWVARLALGYLNYNRGPNPGYEKGLSKQEIRERNRKIKAMNLWKIFSSNTKWPAYFNSVNENPRVFLASVGYVQVERLGKHGHDVRFIAVKNPNPFWQFLENTREFFVLTARGGNFDPAMGAERDAATGQSRSAKFLTRGMFASVVMAAFLPFIPGYSAYHKTGNARFARDIQIEYMSSTVDKMLEALEDTSTAFYMDDQGEQLEVLKAPLKEHGLLINPTDAARERAALLAEKELLASMARTNRRGDAPAIEQKLSALKSNRLDVSQDSQDIPKIVSEVISPLNNQLIVYEQEDYNQVQEAVMNVVNNYIIYWEAENYLSVKDLFQPEKNMKMTLHEYVLFLLDAFENMQDDLAAKGYATAERIAEDITAAVGKESSFKANRIEIFDGKPRAVGALQFNSVGDWHVAIPEGQKDNPRFSYSVGNSDPEVSVAYMGAGRVVSQGESQAEFEKIRSIFLNKYPSQAWPGNQESASLLFYANHNRGANFTLNNKADIIYKTLSEEFDHQLYQNLRKFLAFRGGIILLNQDGSFIKIEDSAMTTRPGQAEGVLPLSKEAKDAVERVFHQNIIEGGFYGDGLSRVKWEWDRDDPNHFRMSFVFEEEPVYLNVYFDSSVSVSGITINRETQFVKDHGDELFARILLALIQLSVEDVRMEIDTEDGRLRGYLMNVFGLLGIDAEERHFKETREAPPLPSPLIRFILNVLRIDFTVQRKVLHFHLPQLIGEKDVEELFEQLHISVRPFASIANHGNGGNSERIENFRKGFYSGDLKNQDQESPAMTADAAMSGDSAQRSVVSGQGDAGMLGEKKELSQEFKNKVEKTLISEIIEQGTYADSIEGVEKISFNGDNIILRIQLKDEEADPLTLEIGFQNESESNLVAINDRNADFVEDHGNELGARIFLALYDLGVNQIAMMKESEGLKEFLKDTFSLFGTVDENVFSEVRLKLEENDISLPHVVFSLNQLFADKTSEELRGALKNSLMEPEANLEMRTLADYQKESTVLVLTTKNRDDDDTPVKIAFHGGVAYVVINNKVVKVFGVPVVNQEMFVFEDPNFNGTFYAGKGYEELTLQAFNQVVLSYGIKQMTNTGWKSPQAGERYSRYFAEEFVTDKEGQATYVKAIGYPKLIAQDFQANLFDGIDFGKQEKELARTLIEYQKPDVQRVFKQRFGLNFDAAMSGDSAQRSVVSGQGDAAMTFHAEGVDQKNVGGIDMAPGMLNLEIQGDPALTSAPLFTTPIENVQIDGFAPVIINIQPLTNMPLLLGVSQEEYESQLAKARAAHPPAQEPKADGDEDVFAREEELVAQTF